jgi:predicted Zn finger-like uncharacterized protein
VFAIKAEHLLAAGGRVRCGECGQVFRAFDYVYEDLAMVQAALAEYHAPQANRHVNKRPVGSGNAGGEVEADDEYDVLADNSAAGILMQPEFSGATSGSSLSWRNVAKGAIIGALLLLLLGAQWLYFNRTELASESVWRSKLEDLCSMLHCELPLRVDLSRIELVNRDVRKHPQVAGALMINATLVNRAGFTQPYPVLAITFSNPSGTPVAARRFNPAEYLDEQADIEAGMPTDTPLQVVLEIEDPGEDAVSFQFEFL